MKTQTIKATFTGKNGSLGYVTGKTYLFRVSQAENIRIEPISTTNVEKCEYESIIAFLNNWDNITK